MADIKTSKLVLPADINGSGSPVGGIEPVNISYCTMNCNCYFLQIFSALISTIFLNKDTAQPIKKLL